MSNEQVLAFIEQIKDGAIQGQKVQNYLQKQAISFKKYKITLIK